MRGCGWSKPFYHPTNYLVPLDSTRTLSDLDGRPGRRVGCPALRAPRRRALPRQDHAAAVLEALRPQRHDARRGGNGAAGCAAGAVKLCDDDRLHTFCPSSICLRPPHPLNPPQPTHPTPQPPGCALQFTADDLLPALVRSLDAMKQPAAKVSVMEFCVLFIGEGKAAGVPLASLHLRQWVARTLPLLLDKTPGVRRMAARTLASLNALDAAFVASCLREASSKEVVAFERAMAAPDVMGGQEQSRPGSPGAEGPGSAYEEEAGPSGGYGGGYAAQGSQPPQHHGWQHQQPAAAAARPGYGTGISSGGSGGYVPPAAAAAVPPPATFSSALAAEASSASVFQVGDAGRGNGVAQDVLGRTFVAPVGPQQPHVEVSSTIRYGYMLVDHSCCFAHSTCLRQAPTLFNHTKQTIKQPNRTTPTPAAALRAGRPVAPPHRPRPPPAVAPRGGRPRRAGAVRGADGAGGVGLVLQQGGFASLRL